MSGVVLLMYIKKCWPFVFLMGVKKEIRNFGTMTEDILEMVKWLKEADCQAVAMESTGVYWKPIYNILLKKSIFAIWAMIIITFSTPNGL